jgi:hypothetical protein
MTTKTAGGREWGCNDDEDMGGGRHPSSEADEATGEDEMNNSFAECNYLVVTTELDKIAVFFLYV